MEFYAEASALKSSLRRELAKTMTQQALLEEFWSLNAANSNVNCSEDFPVDCFLDFSQEKETEIEEAEEEEEEEEEEEFSDEQEEEDKDNLSSVSSQERENDDSNSNSSCTFSSESFLDSEFSEPVEELKELEWVSQFVDDSLSEFSLLCPKPETLAENRFEAEPKTFSPSGPCFSLPAPVPAKARSKRPRTTSRVWSLGSTSLTETTTFSSSPSPSSSSSSGLSTVTFDTFNNQVQIEPPAKKPKKKTAVQTNGGVSGGSPVQRRCSHCQVQKTPQWRTGPLGAKTLCNACGVRYKSGRLFPEYRPACSPTFSGDVHSNSHRKVLEMRRKKEIIEPEPGLTQMVQSF